VYLVASRCLPSVGRAVTFFCPVFDSSRGPAVLLASRAGRRPRAKLSGRLAAQHHERDRLLSPQPRDGDAALTTAATLLNVSAAVSASAGAYGLAKKEGMVNPMV
jgi:hypothetical protein